MRSLGVLLVGLALTMAACSPAAAPPIRRVYDVQVDAKAPPFSLVAGAYFPSVVQAHPGDTIRFTAVDRGELHTVTFGTLVEAALRAIAAAPSGSPPPELRDLDLPPVLIGKPPIDLGQSAVQPCFVAKGVPPSEERCSPERQRQPELTGTHSFFNSGYLPGDAVFAVRLADSIAPGTYDYICLLHGPEMRGRIVVVEREREVPSPAQVAVQASAELADLVGRLEPAIRTATRDLPTSMVLAGIADGQKSFTQATVFKPEDVRVRVGDPVTWVFSGALPHTISFNAPQDAVGTVVRTSDGAWALNRRLIDPERAPRGGAPPDGAATLDGGSWDGSGFWSTGVIDPRRVGAYRLRFAQPGAYTYKCLFHTDMEGRIRVGE